MSDDLSGRRIAVTGGAGFLGRAVLRRLAAAGYGEPFVPRSAEYDLRDARAARRFLDDARPHVVIHLAAIVGGIGANRENPGRFLHDNLLIGTHLVEACRTGGVEKIVAVGTVCSYPKHAAVPFRESALWDGYPEETNAAYGLAKKMLLVQLQAYRAQYGLRSAYLIPANLYGPNDNFDESSSHVIPALVRRFVEAGERGEAAVTCWGTGTATREFLYVDDCAEAVVLAAQRLDDAQPLNIGTGCEISILDLAQRIRATTGFAGRMEWDPTQPDGQPRRRLDVTLARERLGFVARTPLETGLQRTVEDYLERRGASG